MILGNCNGALYIYEIFRYFHQRSWVPNPIFNSTPMHMLYTLGTKERIENIDLGKDWKIWIKCQKEYQHSQA